MTPPSGIASTALKIDLTTNGTLLSGDALEFLMQEDIGIKLAGCPSTKTTSSFQPLRHDTASVIRHIGPGSNEDINEWANRLMTTHRVLQVGLGPLGRMLTPVLEAKTSIDVVSALDIDPELEGTDLSDLTGTAKGVAVTSDVAQALGQSPDVAVVTTVSEFDRLEPQIIPLIEAGVHVVSTCEELSYPWVTQPEISARIDRSAKAKEVTVLGTGINPGFLMDFLPSAVTAVCRRVDAVLVERIQDATTRRLPFRQKIGAELTAEAFNERVESGKIRHVGLTESMHLVAAKLGWTLDRTEDVVEPVAQGPRL